MPLHNHSTPPLYGSTPPCILLKHFKLVGPAWSRGKNEVFYNKKDTMFQPANVYFDSVAPENGRAWTYQKCLCYTRVTHILSVYKKTDTTFHSLKVAPECECTGKPSHGLGVGHSVRHFPLVYRHEFVNIVSKYYNATYTYPHCLLLPASLCVSL